MSNENSRDPIIGLDIGGRSVFYCNRSTLTNEVGSYFAVRFDPESMLSPGESRTDEYGRQVYFIDRDPDVFPYIMQYLRTKEVPGLPDFHENRTLWRQLRKEAAFYSLDGLSSLLKVTYSCTPEHTDQGVLYWLGTRKGSATEYQNPFTIGAVHVGGWVDDLTTNVNLSLKINAGSAASRASFIQYRPEITEPSDFMDWWANDFPDAVAFVDLKEIQLRPTHYSIRAMDFSGMNTNWNLEGSLDGENWAVLHEGRKNDYIGSRTSARRAELNTALDNEEVARGQDLEQEEKSDFWIRTDEHDLRRTWDVRASVGLNAFYRFFRIRKVGNGCLNGTGLELFGDVFES